MDELFNIEYPSCYRVLIAFAKIHPGFNKFALNFESYHKTLDLLLTSNGIIIRCNFTDKGNFMQRSATK